MSDDKTNALFTAIAVNDWANSRANGFPEGEAALIAYAASLIHEDSFDDFDLGVAALLTLLLGLPIEATPHSLTALRASAKENGLFD